MTQLPATLPQPGTALGKQRAPASAGAQLMAGSKGPGGETGLGQDGGGEDNPQFVVPDRLVTQLSAAPASAPKPMTPAILPEISQMPVDDPVEPGPGEGESLAERLDVPDPIGRPTGYIGTETEGIPGQPDLAVLAQASMVSPADMKTPAARLQSAVAPVAVMGRQSNTAGFNTIAPIAMELAEAETPANSGRPGGPLYSMVDAGPNRAQGIPGGAAQLRSVLGERIDARRTAQSSAANDIRPVGSQDAKVEAAQTGRPEVKVTVMHQETHFGSAPLQDMQLADIGPRRSNVLAQPGQPTMEPANLSPRSAAPLRVLHLHLEPAELGGVVVKMSLKGDALTVQIQPQLLQTASMLRSDSAVLNSILQAAGVLADNATVQITDPASTSNAAGNEMWNSNQDADQSGSAQRGNADAREGQKTRTGEVHDDAGQGAQDEEGDADLSGVRSELYL